MSTCLLINRCINARTRRKPVIFGKKPLLDDCRPEGLDLLALLLDLLFREKDGHKLIAAFADLAADVFEIYRVTEMKERLLPGLRMAVDRVDQCPIDIENDGSNQSCLPTAWRKQGEFPPAAQSSILKPIFSMTW